MAYDLTTIAYHDNVRGRDTQAGDCSSLAALTNIPIYHGIIFVIEKNVRDLFSLSNFLFFFFFYKKSVKVTYNFDKFKATPNLLKPIPNRPIYFTEENA